MYLIFVRHIYTASHDYFLRSQSTRNSINQISDRPEEHTYNNSPRGNDTNTSESLTKEQVIEAVLKNESFLKEIIPLRPYVGDYLFFLKSLFKKQTLQQDPDFTSYYEDYRKSSNLIFDIVLNMPEKDLKVDYLLKKIVEEIKEKEEKYFDKWREMMNC